MNMFYKFQIEDDFFGEGTGYIETGSNGAPLRQVEDYNDLLLYAYADLNQNSFIGTCYISDHFIEESLETAESKISSLDFERKWSRALQFQDLRLNIVNRYTLTREILDEIRHLNSENSTDG